MSDYYTRRMRQLDHHRRIINRTCLAFGIGGFVGLAYAVIFILFD